MMNHNSQTLTSSDASADETVIRSLYQQLMEGWNAASGYAFAAPFEEDGDLVGKVKSVRFLTSDVAIMHAIGGTVMAGQTNLEPERNSVQTLVAVKRGTKWHLAAFQNTRATYIGRPEESWKLTEELRTLL